MFPILRRQAARYRVVREHPLEQTLAMLAHICSVTLDITVGLGNSSHVLCFRPQVPAAYLLFVSVFLSLSLFLSVGFLWLY